MRYVILEWPDSQEAMGHPGAITLLDGRYAVPSKHGDHERVDWPDSQFGIEQGMPTDGQSAFVPISRKKCCLRFHYMYRDANNWKTGHFVTLKGEMPEGIESPEGYEKALKELCGGEFVASQVGLQPLYGWEGYPGGNDHCWHEIVGVDALYCSGVDSIDLSPLELYRRFKEASEEGWNPDLEITVKPCYLESVYVLFSGSSLVGAFKSIDSAKEGALRHVKEKLGCENPSLAEVNEGAWIEESTGIMLAVAETKLH